MTDAPPPLARGRYELLEVLGAGGMARVYRAYDARLRVFRAVKLLSPEYAEKAKLRKRFETEATTMARLRHAHIVAVHDVGAEGARVYMVMDLVEGGNLHEWSVAHGAMPPRLAVDALRPVLDAMTFAHTEGVVHRDLKPQNILLAPTGQALVTDFGIAQVAENTHGNLTRTGTVMGTWGYMAPEQRHSARKVDARSDVYALGACLYALVTAETPVDLFALEHEDDLLAGVHPGIAEVITRATAYKARDRYATVADMAVDLDALAPELPAVPDDLPALGVRPEGAGVPLLRAPARTSGTWSSPEAAAAAETQTLEEFAHLDGGGAPGLAVAAAADARPPLPAIPTVPPTPPPASDATLAPYERGSGALEPTAETPAAVPHPHRRWRSVAIAAMVLGGSIAVGLIMRPGVPDVVTPVAPAPTTPVVTAGVVAPTPADDAPADGDAAEDRPTPSTAPEPTLGVPEPGSADADGGAGPVVAKPRQDTPPATAPGTDPPAQDTAQDAGSDAADPPDPAPAAPGTVYVDGQVRWAALVDAAGVEHNPGQVPPGTYAVRAVFEGRDKATGAGSVTVTSGQTVRLQCNAAFAKCQ